MISVFPLLFTQGINEQQIVANIAGETSIQEEINKENLICLGKKIQNLLVFCVRIFTCLFFVLANYYGMYRCFLVTEKSNDVNDELKELDDLFAKICKVVVYGRSEKNTGTFFLPLSLFSYIYILVLL